MLKEIVEIRWHGRGGQGAWTASELLAKAAVYEGKHIQSFPEFGPERMGAPVTAFTRISSKPIKLHCAVYNPDVVVVLDQTLIRAVPVADGLGGGGKVIVNSRDNPWEVKRELGVEKVEVWTVPATEIAVKILGAPITSTAMLGAVARVTGVVGLESIKRAVGERFRRDIAEKNFAVIEESYREVRST
jgi:2-oxoacid:acceptor oxidoreductase gamma subunit (pyruvate/2-ketoisovalerate family)